MSLGTFHGIGIGPGDPELLTVKAAGLLGRTRNVFVPKAKADGESVALEIVRRYLSADAKIHEMVFPMTTDREKLAQSWDAAAERVAAVLENGEDACFLTLGDALVYSTYIYLLRSLKRRLPSLEVETVPGITSFSAAAALTDFPLGEAKELITIVPTSDDLTAITRALETGGTVVLMKIGKRLQEILDLLEASGVLEDSVFVSRAGHAEQRIELDLRRLRQEEAQAGYLSVILVLANRRLQ
jgi:precorrin-2/cobalt-factor-2 C20-methyltransferase